MTQYLTETKEALMSMIRLAGAEDDVLVQLQILSDFSYAWHLIDQFTGLMQDQIKREPRRVAELRSTFLKLSGAMEGAMLRLGEAQSKDLFPVSQYYSRRLVTYIRYKINSFRYKYLSNNEGSKYSRYIRILIPLRSYMNVLSFCIHRWHY